MKCIPRWITYLVFCISSVFVQMPSFADDTFSGNVYLPNGNLGVGTTFNNRKVQIQSSSAPGIQIRETGDGSGFFEVINTISPTVNQASFRVIGATGEALIDYDPVPQDQVSRASFRLFRNTNTAGLKSIAIHRGNGTSALSGQIGIGSASFFNLDGGNFGIGTASPSAKLDVAGTAYVSGDVTVNGILTTNNDISVNGEATVNVLNILGGSDFSERFNIETTAGKIEPGMVVCIDPNTPGSLILSTKAYDLTVAGIVSGAGGVQSGVIMGQENHPMAYGKHPVALTGRVYCWVEATKNPVIPGDLLTTSDIPGHAMKVTDYDRARGTVIGKAMTSLDKGCGLVLVLVSLQ